MRASLTLIVLAAAITQAAAQPMPRQLNVAAGVATAAASDSAAGGQLMVGGVQLRGLDTLNGTVRDIVVPVGETVRFGHLDITVEACRVPPAEAGADSYALLRIRDIREDEPRFAGWMFASSPALSALDHPRYDVWVLSCNNA